MKYTIQRGDTLSAIALRFYGRASKWPDLWGENYDVLRKAQNNDACRAHGMTGPDWIFPGTTIDVPTPPAAQLIKHLELSE